MTFALTTVASVLALYGEGRYIVSVIKGRSRPNFSGWFIFSVSMTLVTISAYTLGARDTIPLIVVFTLLHATVCVLSLTYGFVRFTRTDIVLLSLSGISLLLWLSTSSPWYTLVLNVLIDMFGFMTIADKLRRHPGTEDVTAWGISAFAYVLNLFAISSWTTQEYLFSLSNVFWCTLITILSVRNGRNLERQLGGFTAK